MKVIKKRKIKNLLILHEAKVQLKLFTKSLVSSKLIREPEAENVAVKKPVSTVQLPIT